MNTKLSTKIDELAQFLGKTRNRIAKEIGISHTQMSRICNGTYTPRQDIAGMICDKYNIDRNYFETDLPIEECITVAEPQEKEVGKRVKEIRHQLNMKQSELAELSGIPKSIISRMERGETLVFERYSQKLSKALNVGEEWLLTGIERNKKYPLNGEMIAFLMDHEEVRVEIWKMMNGQGSKK